MYLVLVGGGHAAGKRTVAEDLVSHFEIELPESSPTWVTKIIDLKSYQTEAYKPSIDFEKLRKYLEELPENTVVFLHGNYALYDPRICDLSRLKVYLDTDSDLRLSRWILRDSGHRALEDILEVYLNKCRIEFIQYIEQTKKNCDVLLPQGSDKLSIELLVNQVLEDLKKNSSKTAKYLSHPVINLRAELADSLEGTYYSTN